MPTIQVVIDVEGEAPGSPGVSRTFNYSKVSPTPPLVTLSLDDDTGITEYAWEIVRQPQGAAAVLSNPAAASPTFTPAASISGTYLVECVVNGDVNSYGRNGLAFLTRSLGMRKPAPTETKQFSPVRGWEIPLAELIDIVDSLNASIVGIRRRAVIDIVDCTVAPPPPVESGDRYILDYTPGTIHPDWDGAPRGSIVEYITTAWHAETPSEGWVAYVDEKNTDYRFIDDGTPAWEIAVTSTNVPTDTTNFDAALSADDDTVQKALDTLDVVGYLYPEDAESLEGKALTVSGTAFYTGKLSDGNTNYKGSDPAGSEVDYIFKDGTFTINSPEPSTTFNKSDIGAIDYKLNGSQKDTVSLSTYFSESERAGDQVTVPWLGAAGDLSIVAVGWYNGWPMWQKGRADIAVSPADLQQGYNTFQLEHSGIPTPQASAILDGFYDNDAGADPSVGIPTVVENAPVWKYLSGIKFYYRASTFDLGVVGSDVFDNVYHSVSPLTYASTGSTMGSGIIAPDDGSVSGVSDPPVIGETMTVTAKLLTVPSSNVRSLDARASVTPRDPYGSYTAQWSASENRLVDAYANTSSALVEYFDDENYRMPLGAYDSVPSQITGQWTGSTLLSGGNAQVIEGQLKYPTADFTSGYLPAQNPSADYSVFSGNQVYLRFIEDPDSDPHSNGQLELGGLVGADVSPVGSGNVNVEIKLPTQTGWMDLGKSFDAGTFTGVDGDGCQVSQSGVSWNWTCGTFSTANSGYMIAVRITLRNSSRSLTQMRELGW